MGEDHRLARARRLGSYEEARRYYLERQVRESGPPESWGTASRAVFSANMDRWRSTRSTSTHGEEFCALAAAYGVHPPFAPEDLARLVVALAGELGKPGFELEVKRSGRALEERRDIEMCARMELHTLHGMSQREAAEVVGQEMAALPSVGRRRSIYATRTSEIRRSVADAIGVEPDTEDLPPIPHTIRYYLSSSQLSAMEVTAIEMIDQSRLAGPRKYSQTHRLAGTTVSEKVAK